MVKSHLFDFIYFFFQAEDGIRDDLVTGVQTCALPISVPSELLVIGDETADPSVVALEMLAQAEHDPLAAVVVVTTSARLATAINKRLDAEVRASPRETIIRDAFAARGGIVTLKSVEEMISFASTYAAEHVLVCCRGGVAVAARVQNSGTIVAGAAGGAGLCASIY